MCNVLMLYHNHDCTKLDEVCDYWEFYSLKKK